MPYAGTMFEVQIERERHDEAFERPAYYCATCCEWYTRQQMRVHRRFEQHTQWYNERGERL